MEDKKEAKAYKPKRRVLIPSWVWFWVHKAVFFGMTTLVFFNLPGNDRAYDSYFYPDDHLYYNFLGAPQDHLHKIVRSGILQMVAIALMCLVTFLSIRAYRKENADIDLMNDIKKKGEKRTLVRFIKGFADILLDLIMVCIAIKSFNAVNYTFLSADRSDCNLFSKMSMAKAVDIADKSHTEAGHVVTERYDVKDVSAEATDSLTYKPSEVSPYVWSIWLPGKADFMIWLDMENPVETMSEFIMMDIKEEREETIQLYSLKCGDNVFPISEWDYERISSRLSDGRYEYFDISYYKNSRIPESWDMLTTEDVKYEKGVESAEPILKAVVDLISRKDYDSIPDYAELTDKMSLEELKNTVEGHLARYDAKETFDYEFSRRDNRKWRVSQYNEGFSVYYHILNFYSREKEYMESDEMEKVNIDLSIRMDFLYTDDGGVKAYITDCLSSVTESN